LLKEGNKKPGANSRLLGLVGERTAPSSTEKLGSKLETKEKKI